MFKGVMQMALPTSQPLNWLQRLAAWLFRIKLSPKPGVMDTMDLSDVIGKPLRVFRKSNGEWRPVKQPAVIPDSWPNPKVVGRAPQPGMTKPHLRGADPQSLYDFVASKTDWQLIISAGDWYNIARSKSEGRRKPYQLQIFDRKRGRNKQIIASKFFATPNEASDYAMAIINIHLTKHY